MAIYLQSILWLPSPHSHFLFPVFLLSLFTGVNTICYVSQMEGHRILLTPNLYIYIDGIGYFKDKNEKRGGGRGGGY